eukprot:TRINITY_DN1783_c0_g1_i1.p1 TRINITY_DN1783_c0_g1~~TRINITY_DN1783_c0_g1_i1.p1  ORF type:complete len:476 (-),score=96.28 TRINITY_DN1783_c0_g1_i1:19-1446(-)
MDLSSDSLTEIFSYLRCWPLQSCRLVCRKWRAMIDDHFVDFVYDTNPRAEFNQEEFLEALQRKVTAIRVRLPEGKEHLLPQDLRSFENYADSVQSLPCKQLEVLCLQENPFLPSMNTEHLTSLVITLFADQPMDFSHLIRLKSLNLTGSTLPDKNTLPPNITQLSIEQYAEYGGPSAPDNLDVQLDLHLEEFLELNVIHLNFRMKPRHAVDITFPPHLQVFRYRGVHPVTQSTASRFGHTHIVEANLGNGVLYQNLPSTIKNLAVSVDIPDVQTSGDQIKINLKRLYAGGGEEFCAIMQDPRFAQSQLMVASIGYNQRTANVFHLFPESVIALGWSFPLHDDVGIPKHVRILEMNIAQATKIPNNIECLMGGPYPSVDDDDTMLDFTSSNALVIYWPMTSYSQNTVREYVISPRKVSAKAMEELLEVKEVTLDALVDQVQRGIGFQEFYLQRWQQRHGLAVDVIGCIQKLFPSRQ